MGCTSAKHVQVHASYAVKKQGKSKSQDKSYEVTSNAWKAAFNRKDTLLDDVFSARQGLKEVNLSTTVAQADMLTNTSPPLPPAPHPAPRPQTYKKRVNGREASGATWVPMGLERESHLASGIPPLRYIGHGDYKRAGNKIFVDEPAATRIAWQESPNESWQAKAIPAESGQREAAGSKVARSCPICMDGAKEGLLELKSGHAAHKECLEAMISAKWTGKRITFNYMSCFMCRQQLEHPELEDTLAPHVELRRRVTSVCLRACQNGELIDMFDALMAETVEQAEAAAVAAVACFECRTCGEPFAAGRVDCGVEEGTDVTKLQCADCHWKSPSENKCLKHGADDALIKCDWCCNIATFRCGPGMFCNECHQPPYANSMPLHDPRSNEELGGCICYCS